MANDSRSKGIEAEIEQIEIGNPAAVSWLDYYSALMNQTKFKISLKRFDPFMRNFGLDGN